MFTTTRHINREWRDAASMAPKDASVEDRCKWVQGIVPDYVTINWDKSESGNRIFQLVFPDNFLAGVRDFVNDVFPDVSRNCGDYMDENTGYYSSKLNVFVDRTDNAKYEHCGIYA